MHKPLATGQIPDDRTIVVERCRDELSDRRVCVLTPFGNHIHIPWAMAVSASYALHPESEQTLKLESRRNREANLSNFNLAPHVRLA